VRRFPLAGLLALVRELRHARSAHDAADVALAEALGCDLPTADARLAAAPGPRCVVRVVRT
jgi:predicted nucleic acid-binding protein